MADPRILAWLRARLPCPLGPAALGAAAYLIAGPLLAAAHQGLLAVFALALAAGGRLATELLPELPVDPVYGGAAIHVLSGITVRGLAIAGQLGEALHAALPTVFVPPSFVADGAVASAVLEPGGTLAARGVALVAASVASLAVAIWVARWSPAPSWLVVVATAFQLHLLLEQVVEEGPTLRELEAGGLPFLFAALAPVDEAGQRPFLTGQFDQLPDWAVSTMAGLLAAAATYGLAFGAARVVARYWRAHSRLPSAAAALPSRSLRAGLPGALAVLLVATPIGAIADGEIATAPEVLVAELSSSELHPPQVMAEEPPEAVPTAAVQATPPSSPPPTPPALLAASTPAPKGSLVSLEGGNYRYRLLVNGRPAVIRGMGYNPWYSRLEPTERRRRYERDFAALQQMAVNTIEGWFESEFDEVTLDAAQAHGLGVIMPYELNQDYDYADVEIRDAFMRNIAAWVTRYRDHPAVRMWAPGNEMMHRLIYPTIVRGARDPGREARADAFAAFYVQLADMIHDLDPNHPVLYRDAEDLYLARIRTALRRDGKPRPWFIYGTNAYTERIQEVIRRWPEQGIDAPLLVSEFAPGGVGPADRPSKLAWFWSVIRSRPEMVLGGVVYTWATQGPEDLDRVFGLTDPDGHPIDGSVDALARLFRADRAAALGDPRKAAASPAARSPVSDIRCSGC